MLILLEIINVTDLTQLRLSTSELRQKENSLPPAGAVAVLPVGDQHRAVSRAYENLDPSFIDQVTPLRPPPVILPTSSRKS